MSDRKVSDTKKSGLSAQAEELLREALALEHNATLQKKSPTEVKEDSPLHQITEAAHTITSAARKVGYTKEFILGVHERVTAPMWRIFSPLFGWIIKWYSKVWNRFVFVKAQGSENRKFSRPRATLLFLATIAAVFALTPTKTGRIVRFFTVEPVIDGVMILVSMRTEQFYLNNSEEVDPDENIHAVRGCSVEGKCSETEAVYFRVAPRLAHDIWKLVTHGNPVFVPDHVVAPIAPGVNRCDVTYYGYRMTSSWISRVVRALQIYPTMVEASCEMVSK